jgi:hypothetical protein
LIGARATVGIVVGALAVAGALVAPAFGATEQSRTRRVATAPSASTPRFNGTFTPAAADPRLAAVFARSGIDADSFQFTPADMRSNRRAVTVAVRARSNRSAIAALGASRAQAQAPTVGIAPIAYNLGVSVGWKRFAVAGNATRIDTASLPGGREAADVAVTYSAGRASSRLAASADRPLEGANKLIESPSSYSVDLSSSYSLTRNLDVTAGLRYRSDRERLTNLDTTRRDSQAVYLGTAFRF